MPDPSDPSRSATRAANEKSEDPKLAARAADEPMSEVQRTTLETLCREAGMPFDGALSTADAARRITQMQQAKDRSTEATRVARGAASKDVQSDVGEEDPGAALDAPGNKQAFADEAAATGKPALR